jgi:MFS transporter, DHA1 family, tetracycline resistance protein
LIWLFFQETHKVRKSAPIRLADGIRNLKRAFQIQNLRVLFLMCIFFCLGWSFFYEFLPVIWIDSYGFDSTQVGFFFAFGSICYALSSGMLIRPIVNRFKPGPVLFYSLCALGSAILLLLLHPSASWIWVYLPIVNFLIALVYPTYITMISDWAGPDAQGEILGISGSLQALAFALSPLAAGFLVGADTYMPMFVGGLSTLLAGIIGGLWLTKRSH